jgi:hypothetical protein
VAPPGQEHPWRPICDGCLGGLETVDSERQLKHDREQAEADARRDLAYRLAAATGISTPDSPFRYYAYFTMSDDDLLALVEWCERRTG